MKFKEKLWHFIVSFFCDATKILLNKSPAGLENPGEKSFFDQVKKKQY